MKKYLFLLITAGLFTIPAYSDSFYFLGSYVNPQGDSDIFLQNEIETDFETSDLNGFGVTFGYDHFIGEFVNIGGAVGYYQGRETVADSDFVFENGAPILRDIRLRTVPLEANFSVLPLGREVVVIPYIGAGIGVYFWQYEEIGDFVIDRNGNGDVITGSAFSDGADIGFNIHGGAQVPISRSATVIGEIKWTKVDGDLDPEGFDPRFEPIDLSTVTYSGGVSFWF
jgi:Outer membrane protein beta-barrel domain